jgi:hypothetical protein
MINYIVERNTKMNKIQLMSNWSIQIRGENKSKKVPYQHNRQRENSIVY